MVVNQLVNPTDFFQAQVFFNPDGSVGPGSGALAASGSSRGTTTNLTVAVAPLAAVPEPSTLTVFAGLAGAGGLIGCRRSTRTAALVNSGS